MPSPKWKLVVDIGEPEDNLLAASSAASASDALVDEGSASSVNKGSTSDVSSLPQGKDDRIAQVIAILGKYMPSDPASPLAPYVSGFMSLRLMLLRPSRTAAEEELVTTMLDSFSSYNAGGREESDIAVMLARDFLFLNQQPQSHSFLDAGTTSLNQHQPAEEQAPAAVATNSSSTGLSLFGLPSTSFSPENSPALAPIPAPRSIDGLSIVST